MSDTRIMVAGCDREWWMRGLCPNCGCVFDVPPEEGVDVHIVRTPSSRTPVVGHIYTVNCPHCGLHDLALVPVPA